MAKILAQKKPPVVVMLHGWAHDPDNQKKWQPFIAALRAYGIESRWLGLPGLSAPLDVAWTLDDYVQWLDQQIGSQRNLILLGHSFGGQIAIRYAARHQSKLRQLILIAASGMRDHSWLARSKRALFGQLARWGRTVIDHQVARTLLYRLAGERDYLQAPPILRQTMANVIRDEVVADAAQVVTPALIVWGEHDRVTPPWMGLRWHHLLVHSQWKVINTARHSPQFTHSDQVAREIERFIKEGEAKVNGS